MVQILRLATIEFQKDENIEFQEDKDIKVDGIVGPNTWRETKTEETEEAIYYT